MSSIEYLAKSRICFTFKPDNGPFSLKNPSLRRQKFPWLHFLRTLRGKYDRGLPESEKSEKKQKQIVIYKAKENVLVV